MNFKPLALVAISTLFAGAPVAAEAAFTFSADGLADNAMLAKDAGCTQDGGANHAPGFVWVDPPAGTNSFAIIGFDPDGGKGAGATHVLIYNIPASAKSIDSAQIAAHAYTPGTLSAPGFTGYRGPCPPAGDPPHHYLVTIYALDLPATLPAGLDHDGLLRAMSGHGLEATSAVLRYQRTP